MNSQLRPYRAIICQPGSNSVGVRVTTVANSLAEAKQQLEKEYGEGTVFNLHNDDDADRPR